MDFLLFSSFLQQGLLTHFDTVDFKDLGDLHTKYDCFCNYLDKKNILPEDFTNAVLIPNWNFNNLATVVNRSITMEPTI